MENPTPPDSFAPAPVPPLAETQAVEPAPVRISWVRSAWRWFKTGVVVLFVCWQLFFLVVRNPLDFWYASFKKWCEEEKIWDDDKDPAYGVKPLLDPIDDVTLHYGNFGGIDQNWRMFTPPLARYAYFLAARIEFAEGGEEVIRSENEVDPRGYFRFGGWRQRKLEDYLVTTKANCGREMKSCRSGKRTPAGRYGAGENSIQTMSARRRVWCSFAATSTSRNHRKTLRSYRKLRSTPLARSSPTGGSCHERPPGRPCLAGRHAAPLPVALPP